MKKKLLMLLVLGLTLGACASSDSPDSADSISPVPPVESPEDGGAEDEEVTPESPDDDGSGDEDSGETTPTNPELEVQEGDEYTAPDSYTKTIGEGEEIEASTTGNTIKSSNSGYENTEVNGIVNSTENNYALEARADGYILNNGTVQGDGRGIKAVQGGVAVNGVDGKINTTGQYMMRAEENGIVINFGTLGSTSDGDSILYARGQKGDITLATTAINHGELTLSNGARGMYSESSDGAIARSVNYGAINLDGTDSSRGMSAKGIGATIENRGTIIVNGEGNRGMYVEGGASAYNYGTIDLTNSINGRGIYADGDGTIVENTGTIYLNGEVINNGGDDFRDANSNRAFEIKNGASLKNTGEVIVK